MQDWNCYFQFYNDYSNALKNLLLEENKPYCAVLYATASELPERKTATKAIAIITETLICDEITRAVHFNELINETKCSRPKIESFLKNAILKPMIAYKQMNLTLQKFLSSFKNKVMSELIGKVSTLYQQLYTSAEKCSRDLPNPSDRCHNIKMFIKEKESSIWLNSKF
ncbi:unnamed protein product [Medioppia subpectinata]|uniref:Uncharacterized protein n=1 Tax=Medioppia subpectinata TaxID=1979941 RepID=A0A7R9LDX4_9ACAR|nr:unnamed protein product [Medioppia subpectinata]CAG2117984.1 unnamed protein product [Medioppia subpectinata]